MEKIFGWLLHILEIPMEGDINDLQNLLQNLHPKIKFTKEHSAKELQFLDILIKNLNGQIITDIYQKPTDIQQYFHFKSHHRKNCMKSIPYTLASRIHTIITDKNLKKIRLKELHTTMHLRVYSTTLINKGLELAEKIPQWEFRKPKKHNNEKPLAYIATYNKNNPELFTEKWADEQHWPAGFESRLVPDLPLPFIPTLIGLRAFDHVSSRVWWEAATNK